MRFQLAFTYVQSFLHILIMPLHVYFFISHMVIELSAYFFPYFFTLMLSISISD